MLPKPHLLWGLSALITPLQFEFCAFHTTVYICCSVESSEYLSDLLKAHHIPHNVLNARPKYAAREAEIIAQAGRKHAITISTNMAGRGTDIILGGNPKVSPYIYLVPLTRVPFRNYVKVKKLHRFFCVF